MQLPTFPLPTREDLRAMVRLAVPVVTVQLGLMLMGVVDTIIVGHVSAEALAAVALGNIFVVSTCSFGMGVVMALDPLISQAVGSGDRAGVRRSLQRGLVLATILSIPISLVLSQGRLVFTLLGQQPEVIPVAAGYAGICIPGVVAFLGFVALRQSLQGMERVRPIVITIVGANVFNAVLDWALVFGRFGFPRMGALGSAWATTACRWVLVVGLLIAARRELAPLLAHLDRDVLRAGPLWRVFSLGAPIGAHMVLEYLAFAVIAVLMGRLGTVEMAAHQVALNLAALTYMVPLGVSAAAAVRVGHAVGGDDGRGTRRAAGAALLCGGAFMTLTALVFLTAPGLLAAVFTDSNAVRLLAVALIPIAGFFQVFDGLQVVSAGILRGLGDTRAPMIVGLVGFWMIGLPVSLVLAFRLELGAPGLWWGFVAGLGSVAIFLMMRVAHLLRMGVARTQVE